MVCKGLKIIKRLFFVPVCASCGERLSPIPKNENAMHGNVCFCDKCLTEWEKAKAEACPVCYQNACDCFCFPEIFEKEQPNIPSLCFYHPEKHDAQSNAIITMKRVRDHELFDFFAKELAPRIRQTLSKTGVAADEYIFTWVPRNREAISRSGVDQGRELCLGVAKELGGEVLPLFVRLRGKEQKKLRKSERRKNAEQSISLNHGMSGFPKKCELISIEEIIRGKRVVVIDDVMTTGETLKRAVSLLKSAGAERVVVSCVAHGESRTKKNKKA